MTNILYKNGEFFHYYSKYFREVSRLKLYSIHLKLFSGKRIRLTKSFLVTILFTVLNFNDKFGMGLMLFFVSAAGTRLSADKHFDNLFTSKGL
jgi:hypothetical protein